MTSKAAKAKGAERKQRMDTSSLMEQVLNKDNLNAAYLQVVRNKGAAGVDGMTVEELGAYLSENGESIREKLRTRKYKPQPVRRVEIPKPEGGTRKLGVPTVVDRFVQQAVAQVLTPIFEEQFHDHSYGFRPNRCAQQAVLKALEMMKVIAEIRTSNNYNDATHGVVYDCRYNFCGTVCRHQCAVGAQYRMSGDQFDCRAWNHA